MTSTLSTIKILGQEYRVRSDAGSEHLQEVARYVDQVLAEVRRSIPDSQDAAVLAALNIASELLRTRSSATVVSDERLRSLIELVDAI